MYACQNSFFVESCGGADAKPDARVAVDNPVVDARVRHLACGGPGTIGRLCDIISNSNASLAFENSMVEKSLSYSETVSLEVPSQTPAPA